VPEIFAQAERELSELLLVCVGACVDVEEDLRLHAIHAPSHDPALQAPGEEQRVLGRLAAMSAVATPPATADLEARLEALAAQLDQRRIALEQAKDSRCVFTCAYVLITRRLARELPNVSYRDAAWIVELAEAFAALYLDALDASAAGRPTGDAWDSVFDAIDRRHSSVLEDLVFSMTAHIVHDLPVALDRVGREGAAGSRIGDFHAVNHTMAEAIEEIETVIAKRYAPWVRQLDHLGRPYSRILSSYGIRMARGLAWYNADRLADPASREDARASTARSVKTFVDEVLHPPEWTARTVLRFGRFIVGLFRRWPSDPELV
jgi:hypothetical protein